MPESIPASLIIDSLSRMATVVDDLGDLKRRLPEILGAEGPCSSSCTPDSPSRPR